MRFYDDRGNPTPHMLWAGSLVLTVFIHALIFFFNYYPWFNRIVEGWFK